MDPSWRSWHVRWLIGGGSCCCRLGLFRSDTLWVRLEYLWVFFFFHIGSGPFGLPFIKMNLYTSGLGRFLTSALWIESKYSLGNYSVFHENVCLQGSLGRLYTFVHRAFAWGFTLTVILNNAWSPLVLPLMSKLCIPWQCIKQNSTEENEKLVFICCQKIGFISILKSRLCLLGGWKPPRSTPHPTPCRYQQATFSSLPAACHPLTVVRQRGL